MVNFKLEKPSDEVIQLIIQSGNENDFVAASAAMRQLTKALVLPLRQGVLVGDIATSIFQQIPLVKGASLEFPLDLLAPGQENDYVAYTNPGNGRIPEKQVEADFIKIPAYRLANGIDWLLRFAEEGRWDVVARAMQVFTAGFTAKINNDGWHTLLSAAADRNILVIDADATAGQFTKRLVSLMKTVMTRQSGGNTASLGRGRLTDIFFSPESLENIRNWGLDQVDDYTRREIYTAPDGSLTKVFGVVLHDLVELGENQAFQKFFTDQLGGSLGSGDVELLVGVDLSTNDSFVMPLKQELKIFDDPALHRQQRAGVYGWMGLGFGVLDNRRVLLGSY